MTRSWSVIAAGATALLFGSTALSATTIDNRVAVGRAIAPVPLDLTGKDEIDVWLGSYIVNSVGACNDCHTSPPYVEGGNPFLGEPEQINVNHYLCGGTDFGAAISSNITPDEHGLPAGLERDEFIELMRTGEEPDGELLQVMPWPLIGKMIHRDLRAVYAYLTAIPSCDTEESAGSGD